MIETILLLVLSLFLSAFFSGSEVALIGLNELKVRHLVEQKRKNAKQLLYLKKNSNKMLITILIGNNLVNIGGSAIATKLAIDMFQNAGVGIATGVMTFMILTFGEIVPKSLAAKHNKTFALGVAPFILFLLRILYPLVWLFHHMSKLTHKLVGAPKEEPLVTEEEIQDIVSIGEEEGQINADEKAMIERIFRFDDTALHQVMTPRTEMFALEQNMLLSTALPLIIKNEFSRIPVYDKRMDKIKGVVLLRDVLEQFIRKENVADKKLKDIMKEVHFVPEHQKIDSLLKELQERKLHLAIVVNEHGGVEGLITIEDILEEIVGEIFDESDEVEHLFKEAGKRRWYVLGKAPIDELNEALELHLPQGEDFNTLAGLLQEELGRVPEKGDVCLLQKAGIQLTVEKVEGPVVLEVLLERV